MGAIQLFVSHATKDADIAGALVRIVETAFDAPPRSIRCTSAPGYELELGADVSEHLRAHLSQASCVIAVLTPYSLSSKWCLFELGGAWARSTRTYPLLADGLTQKDLPAALGGTLAGQLSDARVLRALLSGLEGQLGWKEKNREAAENEIKKLIAEIRKREISTDDVDEELGADFVAKFHLIGDAQQDILNYIVRNGQTKEHIPFAELEQAFPRAEGLYYRLLQLRYLRFLRRIAIGQTSRGVPRYAWTLTPEYAERVWRQRGRESGES